MTLGIEELNFEARNSLDKGISLIDCFDEKT